MAEREDDLSISLKKQNPLYAFCHLPIFQYKVINQFILLIEESKFHLLSSILKVITIVFLFYISLLASKKL
ncbi:hypothetical protein [Psychromonas sp. SP041]|uniref:hypothetical protein n=1 Tax=Psychromonas sp. SP041 TaxID=1365007 RepID=UPI00042119E8|nr:hypothetical protein [Psychromonas sp. SP041]